MRNLSKTTGISENSLPKLTILYLLKLPFIILVLIFSQFSSAQDFISVSGKVIDSQTNRPIFLATISICDNPIGVTTNENGEFTFNIPNRFKNSDFCISCMGYVSIIKPLKDYENESKIYYFNLKPNIIDIDEVEIFSKRKRIHPKAIVEKAIDLISKNYPQKSFLLLGYYRDYLKHNAKYINLLEIALELEDKGFSVPDFENSKIKVLQTRFNSDYDYDKSKNISYDNDLMKYIPGARLTSFGGNELSILRAHDPVRNFNRFSFSFADVFTEDFIKKHYFFLDSVTLSGDQYIYCINFSYINKSVRSSDYSSFGSGHYYTEGKVKIHDIKGKIFISADNYSIKKIIYTNFFNDNEHHGKIYEFIVEYKEYRDKMYLNYLSFSNYFEIQDLSKTSYFKLDSAIFNKDTEKLELYFNNKIDITSSLKIKNFKVWFDNLKIKINGISNKDSNTMLLDLQKFIIPDDYDNDDNRFSIKVRKVFDTNGNEAGKINTISMYQFRELFINEIKTENFKHISSKEAISKTTPLFYFKKDDKPKFWDTYNFTRNKSLLK